MKTFLYKNALKGLHKNLLRLKFGQAKQNRESTTIKNDFEPLKLNLTFDIKYPRCDYMLILTDYIIKLSIK